MNTHKVLGNRLLVEPIPEEHPSVIVRPEAWKRREKFHAIVRQVGTGKDIPAEIRVGSKVLINRITGIDAGDDTKIVHLDSVLLVYCGGCLSTTPP